MSVDGCWLMGVRWVDRYIYIYIYTYKYILYQPLNQSTQQHPNPSIQPHTSNARNKPPQPNTHARPQSPNSHEDGLATFVDALPRIAISRAVVCSAVEFCDSRAEGYVVRCWCVLPCCVVIVRVFSSYCMPNPDA